MASEKSYEDAESVAGEVTKETALLLARAEEEEPVVLMDGLEHNENVGEWAKAIALWMQQRGCGGSDHPTMGVLHNP